MKKVYAVRRGRQTGLFHTWDECRAQVDGFAGAQYKGFTSAAEAMQWLTGSSAPAVRTAKPAAAPRLFDLPEPEVPVCDFVVYTDGSCLRNPDGPGGYAAVILPQGEKPPIRVHGGEPSTTNNRMELRAAIEGLAAIRENASVLLYTDSQYMKNGFTKNWVRNWKRNGWRTAKGTAVLNKDLWLQLDEQLQRHRVSFQWVKGHAGHEYNEQCDELAKSEAMKYSGPGVAFLKNR